MKVVRLNQGPNLFSRNRHHRGKVDGCELQCDLATRDAGEVQQILNDASHVAEQRARYNARRDALRPALVAAGFHIEFSNSGLYIWCTRNEDAWTSVEWLAQRGILATPGGFYGAHGARHIRIAMTATDAQINDAVSRLKA